MIHYDSFETITFDCYGTLIDWEKGICNALQPLLGAHGLTVENEQLLESYAEIESEIEAGPYQTYESVLLELMAKLSERYGFLVTAKELGTIADSIADWPPFDDVVTALKKLKSKYELAIISNIDDALFAHSNEHLKVDFDFVITAQQVGAYKPSARMFERALETIDRPKEKILHVAQSLYHDHVPAKAFGLSTVWINRRHNRPGSGATPEAVAIPDAEFPDLASFAKATGL